MSTQVEFITNYAPYYSSKALAKILNDIEMRGHIVNEERFFKNFVNPSGSRNLPYYRWVRYREGYSGELVKELIRRSDLTVNQYVFDPMCGAGSTIVAAMEMGYSAVGSDVLPYSVDLANAKFEKYNQKSLGKIRSFIDNSPDVHEDNSHYIENNNGLSSAQRYFQANNFDALVSIRRQLEKVQDKSARKFLWAAWLAILEDCSERKKDGNGLATRPSKVTDVWSRFAQQVKIMLDDVTYHTFEPSVYGHEYLESALNSTKVLKDFDKKSSKTLGAIIFSPPYANSFDYFESYKIELLCGYYDPKSLVRQRANAIRNYRKGYGRHLLSDYAVVNYLCDEIKDKIPEKEARTGKVDNRSRLVPNMLVGYFADMERALREFYAAMPKGTHCYIVVDQSAYLGVVIPTDLVLADIGEKIGFRTSSIIRCRRAATSSQQLKQFPYLNNVLRESIVTLAKT